MHRINLLKTFRLSSRRGHTVYAWLSQKPPLIGLITKIIPTSILRENRKKGAQQKAEELGVELRTFCGALWMVTTNSQVQAIENLISAGARYSDYAQSDTSVIVPTNSKSNVNAGFAGYRV